MLNNKKVIGGEFEYLCQNQMYQDSIFKNKKSIMKISLVEIETPFFSGYTLFEKINLDLLQETKTINISFSKPTKTRISTSMQIGKSRNSINFNIDWLSFNIYFEFN